MGSGPRPTAIVAISDDPGTGSARGSRGSAGRHHRRVGWNEAGWHVEVDAGLRGRRLESGEQVDRRAGGDPARMEGLRGRIRRGGGPAVRHRDGGVHRPQPFSFCSVIHAGSTTSGVSGIGAWSTESLMEHAAAPWLDWRVRALAVGRSRPGRPHDAGRIGALSGSYMAFTLAIGIWLSQPGSRRDGTVLRRRALVALVAHRAHLWPRRRSQWTPRSTCLGVDRDTGDRGQLGMVVVRPVPPRADLRVRTAVETRRDRDRRRADRTEIRRPSRPPCSARQEPFFSHCRSIASRSAS